MAGAWVVCVSLVVAVVDAGTSESSSSSFSVPGRPSVTHTLTSGAAKATATASDGYLDNRFGAVPIFLTDYYQQQASRPKRGISQSVSISRPGYVPVTSTYTSGNAQAVAQVAPNYYYLQPTAIRPSRQLRRRTDANQQIYQRNIPPSLRLGSPPVLSAPAGISQRFGPPAFAPPPASSAPAGISQAQAILSDRSFTVAGSPAKSYGVPDVAGNFAGAQAQAGEYAPPPPPPPPPPPEYGPPAGSFAGADAQAGAYAPPPPPLPPPPPPAPEPEYGPPAGSFAGADAQAGAYAPPPPPPPPPPPSAPEPEYGPPAGSFAGADAQAGAYAPPPPPPPPSAPEPEYGPPAGSFAGADAQAGAYAPPPPPAPSKAYGPPEHGRRGSSSVLNTHSVFDAPREFEFIPAFPKGRPTSGIELAPPPLSPREFVPPDGALLAPPAPHNSPAPRLKGPSAPYAPYA